MINVLSSHRGSNTLKWLETTVSVLPVNDALHSQSLWKMLICVIYSVSSFERDEY